ncbi:MAG: ABC transporter substrate-binding protein [Oscillospiraceae bacterium]|nr:ABC transporter substrate-binding protein [Oscillospiraceae bacterium]
MKKTLSVVLALCLVLTSMLALAETPVAEPSYTYNAALVDFATNWNPHQYQTATDGDLLTFLSRGFYSFDFNETMDGYVLKPEMAVDFPTDVTADYVDEAWNIAEGDATRAWKFTLRDDLKWQDGTPITAYDFVTSAKFSLNPAAQNYRADGFYTGNMVVTNAEGYLKGGTNADTTIEAYMGLVGAADVAALLAEYGTEPGLIDWSYSFGDTYDFAAQAWTGAAEAGVVDTGLTLAELYAFYTEGAGAEVILSWGTAQDSIFEWALTEVYSKYSYPVLDFESVGIKALSDTELVLILERPLEGFYLYYSMTDSWLVNEALYTQCEAITDGVYTNSYGTTLETTISYGPYMLTEFQSDKVFTLEKNPNWYGYADPANEGLWQTTKIQYDCVKEPETRLQMFLNGQLDTYGLDKDHIAEYASSDYTYYSEGDSVFAMAFNPDLEALTANQVAVGENVNKTILTIKDFRVAMSLAMNRAEFVLACDPTSSPAFALYGGQIVADPDNGIFYRNTDLAKQVVVDFWGLGEEIGPDKLYPTVDDAIDSITGYNLEMAKVYFDSAYDQAVAAGLMDEDDIVTIMVGTPNTTSAFYNAGYDFIVNNYTEAVKGTKLEGKIAFSRDGTLGNGFADALRNNNVDMLFGVGWTGSTFDPYGLMEAYTLSSYQYDPAWDTNVATLDITVGDVTYTATVWEWTDAIAGTEIEATVTGTEETAKLAFPYSTDADEAAQRLAILAALENAVLQNYNFVPLMGDASAALKGMQVEFYTEDEVFPMGRGGIKYHSYNYDDAAWEAYVAEQGGTLNYK